MASSRTESVVSTRELATKELCRGFTRKSVL